jgi:diguanylate cyclase (GGDEF)-like protein
MLHEQTKAIALTDALTGLPNGRALYALFEEQLTEAKAASAPLTVLCFNVVGLRAVNESYGYQAGDRMLAEVAGRLRHAVGEAGILSRIAGNDFIYLPKDCSRAQAIHLGEQVQDQISSFHLEVRPEQYAQVGLSFGVAESPTDGQSIDELVHAAALATRQQKTSATARQILSQPQSAAVSYSQREKMASLTLVG